MGPANDRPWSRDEARSEPLEPDSGLDEGPIREIVLTVPASFDEEARELTVMAARDAGGQIVLVCGGGSSDFSLIPVSREGDLVNFTRTAVGKHLLF